jgi:hypothetical protein
MLSNILLPAWFGKLQLNCQNYRIVIFSLARFSVSNFFWDVFSAIHHANTPCFKIYGALKVSNLIFSLLP